MSGRVVGLTMLLCGAMMAAALCLWAERAGSSWRALLLMVSLLPYCLAIDGVCRSLLGLSSIDLLRQYPEMNRQQRQLALSVHLLLILLAIVGALVVVLLIFY